MAVRKINRRMWFRVLPLTLSVFLAQHEARAKGKEIRLAAAADLKFAMGELSEMFERRTGTKVNVTYGSSGNFFASSAVCAVGECAGGDCGHVAGGFAGHARWETMGDSGGHASGD